VIEHLHNIRLFVQEMKRVLKPGGTALVTSPLAAPGGSAVVYTVTPCCCRAALTSSASKRADCQRTTRCASFCCARRVIYAIARGDNDVLSVGQQAQVTSGDVSGWLMKTRVKRRLTATRLATGEIDGNAQTMQHPYWLHPPPDKTHPPGT